MSEYLILDAFKRLKEVVNKESSNLTYDILIRIKEDMDEDLKAEFRTYDIFDHRLSELSWCITNKLNAKPNYDINFLEQCYYLFIYFIEEYNKLPEKYNNILEEVNELLEKRNSARKNKDWKQSDIFRDEITKRGYKIVDMKEKSIVLKV